jgi:hypothetical protein
LYPGIPGFLPVLIAHRNILIPEYDPASFEGVNLVQIYNKRAMHTHKLAVGEL